MTKGSVELPFGSGVYGTAEQTAGKSLLEGKPVPQRLKPHSLESSCVWAKARTLHEKVAAHGLQARTLHTRKVFPRPVEPCPSFRDFFRSL